MARDGHLHAVKTCQGSKLGVRFDIKSIEGDFAPEKLCARVNERWGRYGAAPKSEVGFINHRPRQLLKEPYRPSRPKNPLD